MENLLYYPYINIPRTDWSLRTLLYYDTIGAIVPQEYFYRPNRKYEPFMQELVRTQLVIPIDPINTLENQSKLFEPFIDFMLINELNFEANRVFFKKIIKCPPLTQAYREEVAVIHKGKIHDDILYTLTQMGLAQDNGDCWYFVESMAADYLMTYLATILGAKLKMRPATDIINQNTNPVKVDSQSSKRESALKELIPFPQEINVNKLREFKDKHLDLLKSFKNKIELIVLNPTLDVDTELFNETINELKLRKDEITARMNENKLGRIFLGTMCGIFGALYGLSTSETTGALLGGLPGFANAIYSALKNETDNDINDQSGMKYLALIDRKLRIPECGTRLRY